MDEQEVDNSMETFMTLFNKMFSETKYNLQALNKRMESMDKCFNNVLLLSSDKPFDEVNEEENEQNNENINIDNLENKLKNTNNSNNLPKKKKQTGKMTSKELDEISNKYNKSKAQICIRYCIERNTLPLPKSVHEERIIQNADIDFEIDKKDMEYLNSLTLGTRKPLRS